MLDRLLDDVRHGTRILTTAPGLSATAALLIALVIGGNTTIYSMVNGLVHAPAPGVTARDLVSFGIATEPGNPYLEYADYEQYAAQTTSLRSLAAIGFSRAAVGTESGNFVKSVTPVTGNYFDTAGIVVSRGRAFTPADDRAGAPLVAVITDTMWRDHFHGAADAIGRSITINGRPATIVGVAPPRFAGIALGDWADLWIPLHAHGVGPTEGVAMIGRLAPGASVTRARAEFETMHARLQLAAPSPERKPLLVIEYSAAAGGVFFAFQTAILAIFSVVTLLTLVVVCANVANLLLARAVVRQRETAVRQSLGASRGRLVRLLVAEGVSIAAVACVLALLVAWWAAWFMPSILPPATVTMPMDFTPDWRVGVYAAVLSVIATLMFSLLPALRTWRQDPLPVLKLGAHTTAAGRSRASTGLVVLQIAFSVLLLTAAGLVYRSQAALISDPGFDPRNMLLVHASVPGTAAPDQRVALDRLRDRLASLPGVTAVTYTGGLAAAWNGADVKSPESATPLTATLNAVGPDYLKTLGLRPVAGRDLPAGGRTGATIAAVVNQNLATALFPGRSPIGQTLLLDITRRPGDERSVEIIGVIPNAHYGLGPRRAVDRPNHVLVSDPEIVARRADDVGELAAASFHVRYTGPLDPLSAAVPGALRDADPRAAISTRETLETRLADRTAESRMIATLLMVFAAMSLVIATVGQYAVVSFTMRRRTRDFGLRIALGASGRQIVGAVLGEGARLTAIGLAAGFMLSAAAATVLRNLLFGVRPTDAPTYGAVFAVLAAVSLVASYLPARRAARINPVQALRQE